MLNVSNGTIKSTIVVHSYRSKCKIREKKHEIQKENGEIDCFYSQSCIVILKTDFILSQILMFRIPVFYLYTDGCIYSLKFYPACVLSKCYDCSQWGNNSMFVIQ